MSDGDIGFIATAMIGPVMMFATGLVVLLITRPPPGEGRSPAE